MQEGSVAIILFCMIIGLYAITAIGEHFASDPLLVRTIMIFSSIIIGVILLSLTNSELWGTVAGGLFAFAGMYVIAPVKAALGDKSLQRSLKLPERGEPSVEEVEKLKTEEEKKTEALEKAYREQRKEAVWQRRQLRYPKLTKKPKKRRPFRNNRRNR